MTEAEWLKSGNPILALEADRGWLSPRKQRLFGVACCRRIQHLLPKAHWLDGLAVAERYADRRAKRDELVAAHAEVPGHPGGPATYARLVEQCVAHAVGWACQTGRRLYVGQVALNAACAAAYSALPPDEPYVPPAESRYHQHWSAAEKAEVAAQIALVYEICGDPFRPTPPPPRRPPREVTRLAAMAYGERLPSSCELEAARLAVLVDALEKYGCADEAILSHLRSPRPHVTGCWALDQLLGKK